MFGTILYFESNSSDTDLGLHCQELISPLLWLADSASVSSPSFPFIISSIVAISCLLYMDFDCSQGAILHVAQSSHTNTHVHVPIGMGGKLALRGFVFQMCCQIKSVFSNQGTLSSLRLLKKDFKQEFNTMRYQQLPSVCCFLSHIDLSKNKWKDIVLFER